MAISLVGSKTFVYSNPGGGDVISLTDLTGGSGASPAADDIVIIVLVSGQVSSDSTAGMVVSGYTALASLFSNDSADTNAVVQSKRMGATPDTNFTTPVLAGSRLNGVVFVFRGVDTTTLLDVAVTTATGINSDSANPPSITPSTTDAWIFAAYAAAQIAQANWTAPTGLTGFIQTGSDKGHSGGGYHAWTGGAYDPAAATGASENRNSWAAATLALRPAANVSVALSGQSVVSSIGTILAAAALGLSGLNAPVSNGNVSPTTSVVLAGQSTTAAQSSLAAGPRSFALTGQSLAVGQGTLAAGPRSFALTGHALAVAPGAAIPTLTFGLTGQSLAVGQGTLTVAANADVIAALTGQSLIVSRGTFGVTTNSALIGQQATVNQGSVVYTRYGILAGQSLFVNQGLLTPGSRNLPVTGQAATVNQGALAVSSGPGLVGQSLNVTQGLLGITLVPGYAGSTMTASQGTLTPLIGSPLTGHALAVSRGSVGISTSYTGRIKAWAGASWLAFPIKVWTGTTWVVKPLKRWNGTSWITTPY